jgi:hypothetical protein
MAAGRKGQKITEQVTLPCAGCSGRATFTPEGERPTFFHTVPYCERFDRVHSIDDLFAYMRDCFAKAGIN